MYLYAYPVVNDVMCFAGTTEIRLYEGVYDEAQKDKLVNFMKCLYNDAIEKPNWSHDPRLEPFMKKIFVRIPGAYYEICNVDFLACANLKLCGTFITGLTTRFESYAGLIDWPEYSMYPKKLKERSDRAEATVVLSHVATSST